MPNISFDVIGTLFSYDVVIDAVKEHLGQVLDEHKLDATLFFYSWFYTCQREFCFASQGNHYVPISTVLSSTLPRALLIAGVPQSKVDSLKDKFDPVTSSFENLTPRPGVKEAFEYLEQHGWTTFAVTNGSYDRTLSYFNKAGVDIPEERILSCDEISIAKADPRVYTNAADRMRKLGLLQGGEGRDGEHIFVASHMWDLCAAKEAGCKTGWVSYEEKITCEDVFGKPDWQANSLMELVEKIVENKKSILRSS